MPTRGCTRRSPPASCSRTSASCAPSMSRECELLWSEWRGLGRLLGIRGEDLPAGWERFPRVPRADRAGAAAAHGRSGRSARGARAARRRRRSRPPTGRCGRSRAGSSGTWSGSPPSGCCRRRCASASVRAGRARRSSSSGCSPPACAPPRRCCRRRCGTPVRAICAGVARRSRAGRSPRYRSPLRVATWNVNSVKQRMPRLLPWLDQRRPDVLCLQETKLADEAFRQLLAAELAAAATSSPCTARRSGTASRSSRASVSRRSSPGCPAGPAFRTPRRAPLGHLRRASACTRSMCPNGRTPDSEHYRYKLAWLAALREPSWRAGRRRARLRRHEHRAADADVFDPAAYVGHTHVTPAERAALGELTALGLHDVVRERWPTSASSPTGTTAPACSTRTSACAST